MPTASSKKVSKSPDARSHEAVIEQSNFQRLWSRFLERKKNSPKRQGFTYQQPQKKGATQNGSVPACSCKPSHSRTQSPRLSATPSASPQLRRTDRLASTASLKSLGTTPDTSPRTLRKNTPSYSRTITKTLPQLPHSGRCRSFGMGPFTTVYRNRFGTFTRVTSSPPTRPRLSVSSSPVLLRTAGTRGTFTRGRPSARSPPNPMRLYHIACATASSAAKQRPPVRPRLPPPPVPPRPPPPPPPRPRPTFASPTQSSVAKQVAPANKYASHSAASTRSGSPVQQTYGSSGRLTSTNRQSCRASSLSLTSLSTKARHLPRSPAPSPTPVKRSETFTRKSAGSTAAAASPSAAPPAGAETERQVPSASRTKLTRSRTFSKDDRVEIVKRDSSPRVFKPKSPSPAQSPDRMTSKAPQVPKAAPPPPSPPAAAPSAPRSPPSAGDKQKAIRGGRTKTPPRATTSTRASAERLALQAQPRDDYNVDEEYEINGASVDYDLPVAVVANGSLRRASKPALTKEISDRDPAAIQGTTANSKTSRSIMVQTTDI
ncbi:uncharacterized protein LOC142572453 [Dermacentor variabilis]|uniref:uncharacterized protein LOC142572453 n=1 Tax=Dermacentor variabilis TaxID=34621 RepID=UPI003F5B7DA0